MNKISILWVALAVLGLSSCTKFTENVDQRELEKNEQAIKKYLTDNNLNATRDTTGLYYVKTQANPAGQKPKLGEEVAVNFTIHRLTDGGVVTKTDSLFRYPFGVNFLRPGIERAVNLLVTGEKGTFLLPFFLLFGANQVDNLPPYSATRLQLELVSVRTEAQQIADYIAQKNYTVAETTPTGIRIVRLNSVPGDTLGKGKPLKVNYEGRTIDGKSFDKGTLELTGGGFIANSNRTTIPGFYEGVRRMRRGEKAIAIFPSRLGYGVTGSAPSIPPYAPLVFELEVLN